MRINHNIAALNTLRQLSSNNVYTAKSLEKLSSGLRINRAGDDAAGLAISEKMRGQIRGLEQATRNAQDGISLIQTAEGALNETHSILQRMRELAVQASNDTNTDADRVEIQKEIDQLTQEIDRISSDTEFNSKSLLDGSLGINVTKTADTANLVSATATDTGLANGTYTVTFANASEVIETTSYDNGGTGVATTDFTLAANTTLGDYTIELSGATNSVSATLKDANGNVLASVSGVDNTSTTIVVGNFTIATNAYNGTAGNISLKVEEQADVSIATGGTTIASVTGATSSSGVFEIGGFDLNVDDTLVAGSSTLQLANNSLTFHIGANKDQTMRAAIQEMSSTKLGVGSLNVKTQSGAENAIKTLDDAIQKVSSERSKLGAYQNRLEHTINNLGTSSENLSAAESRIRDVDMAKEMMEFTKNNILQQAAQAMLAQANQLPQGVLQLLR